MTKQKQTSGTQTEVKQQPKITERTLFVDEARAIERVKKWGHVVSPVLVYNQWRKLVPSEVHYWEQDGLYKKILKHAKAFNPHEEINEHLKTVVKDLGKDYNLQVRDTHYSNNDFNMHIEVVSDRFDRKIKGSFEKDDVVQCGLDLYNGIETFTALGGSMYTYRLACENGAVAKGKEFGTFSIPGVRKAEERLEIMKIGIVNVFEKFTEIINFYERLAVTKTNLKKANEFYLRTRWLIPDIHQPKSFVIDPEYDAKLKTFQKKNEHLDLAEILNLGLKDERNAPLPVVKVKDNPTLWEDFNEITGNINRKHEQTYDKGQNSGRPKLNFSTLSRLTDTAHRGMLAVVRSR
jgi:hypothetical protein